MEKQNNNLKNNEPSEARPGEGLRSLKTSNVFRTLNFELYARPVSINDRSKMHFIPHRSKCIHPLQRLKHAS